MAERDTRFGGNMERANVGEQYSRPRQTGTPNFGGPTRPQGGTYSHELGHTGGYDFNPRPNLKGHFQEPAFHKFPQSGPAGAPVEGPWNREYDTPMRGMGGGLESLESKIDLNDIFNKFPGMNMWRLIQDLDKRGIEYAGNDTGIGSTDEYQMAELSQDQADYMRNPYFSPGLEGAPTADELFNQVKEREDKGSWWNPFDSGQEPTTRPEFDEEYNRLIEEFYA